MGFDRLTREACDHECLDDFKCNFAAFLPADSTCRMYQNCVPAETASEHGWRERRRVRAPELTPCSGRGVCGVTGQCRCDSARYLSVTDPITGEKSVVETANKGTLTNVPLSSLATSPYRASAELTCPGYDETRKTMADVCSGHGMHESEYSQCDVGYVGVACELTCPRKDPEVEETETCSGHGICYESRLRAGDGAVLDEEVKYEYMVHEAWRRFYNLCDLNTVKLDYFITPVDDLFEGTIAPGEMRGGEDCVYVSQLPFDPTQPWIDRPEITVTGVRNFQMLDDEHSLADEFYPLPITGTFAGFARQGYSGNILRKERAASNPFRRELPRLTKIVTDGEGRMNGSGLRLRGRHLSSQDGVLTANECAQLCDSTTTARVSTTRRTTTCPTGRCRLAEAGGSPRTRCATRCQPGANMGLLQTETEDGAPVVGGVPVPSRRSRAPTTLSNTHTCQAPSQSMGVIVNSAETCASLVRSALRVLVFSSIPSP